MDHHGAHGGSQGSYIPDSLGVSGMDEATKFPLQPAAKLKYIVLDKPGQAKFGLGLAWTALARTPRRIF